MQSPFALAVGRQMRSRLIALFVVNLCGSSLSRQEQVQLLFKSLVSEKLRTFWVRDDGKAFETISIEPEKQKVLTTYPTHTFVIRNVDGELLRHIVVPSTPGVYEHVVTISSLEPLCEPHEFPREPFVGTGGTCPAGESDSDGNALIQRQPDEPEPRYLNELRRIKLNLIQPEMVPRFSRIGFKKLRIRRRKFSQFYFNAARD